MSDQVIRRFADAVRDTMSRYLELLEDVHSSQQPLPGSGADATEERVQSALVRGLKSVLATEAYAVEELAGFCADLEAAITEIDPDAFSDGEDD